MLSASLNKTFLSFSPDDRDIKGILLDIVWNRTSAVGYKFPFSSLTN